MCRSSNTTLLYTIVAPSPSICFKYHIIYKHTPNIYIAGHFNYILSMKTNKQNEKPIQRFLYQMGPLANDKLFEHFHI